MAALEWIKSTKHQKVFVANRIAKILANSKSERRILYPVKSALQITEQEDLL